LIKNKKENKNFDQNLTNLYRKVFRIRILGCFFIPAGGMSLDTKNRSAERFSSILTFLQYPCTDGWATPDSSLDLVMYLAIFYSKKCALSD